MKGLVAILRKELANFFVSPIAYSVIASFLLVSGVFFWANISFMSVISLQASNNPMLANRINLTDVVIRPLIQNMSIIMLFVTPLLTMRLFAEEKKSGSIELLLTYPVSDMAIMMGKFLATVVVVLIMLASTFPSVLLLFGIGKPDMGTTLSCYLGLFLMGLAFVSLGLFVSSLTENQIVAGAATFGAAILCWIMSWTSSITDRTLGAVLKQLSILEHLESFNKGIISLPDVSFFVLFIIFFLFMTMRSLETHRWRG